MSRRASARSASSCCASVARARSCAASNSVRTSTSTDRAVSSLYSLSPMCVSSRKSGRRGCSYVASPSVPHAEARHHFAGEVNGVLEIVVRARGGVAEHEPHGARRDCGEINGGIERDTANMDAENLFPGRAYRAGRSRPSESSIGPARAGANRRERSQKGAYQTLQHCVSRPNAPAKLRASQIKVRV